MTCPRRVHQPPSIAKTKLMICGGTLVGPPIGSTGGLVGGGSGEGGSVKGGSTSAGLPAGGPPNGGESGDGTLPVNVESAKRGSNCSARSFRRWPRKCSFSVDCRSKKALRMEVNPCSIFRLQNKLSSKTGRCRRIQRGKSCRACVKPLLLKSQTGRQTGP